MKYYIGIDLGGTNIVAGVVNEAYEILAKVSNRITNEVKHVNRVVYDITSKPPGTVEWL